MFSNHHATLYRVSDVSKNPFDIAELYADTEIYEFKAVKLSIEDVRHLIDIAFGRPLEKPTRTVIVRTGAIGVEAQHALLKILEEPPLSTRFVVIIEQGSTLIPTLLSRFAVYADAGDGQSTIAENSVWLGFVSSAIPDRIAHITEVFKNKDIQTQVELTRGLEEYLRARPQVSISEVAQLDWCLTQLRVHGASQKMLWEQIAFLVPVVEDVERQ